METLWFMIVAVMVAAYVVLDGFDLGAGAIYLGAGKTSDERRKILRAIEPVWDGNEVWLIAAGGTLYFAFPLLYASSFSGFYLPLMMVLWLLMLRGIGIELRAHMENPVWVGFFDLIFCASSVLLAVFFGAALGNVVRGVPLDADGYCARDINRARVVICRGQDRWRIESACAQHRVVGVAAAADLDHRRTDSDLLRAADRAR
jgi:cytochrome d ubiquinol oxidase subunit II